MADLLSRGIDFESDGTRLRWRPIDMVTAPQADQIRACKPELLVLLTQRNTWCLPKCPACGWWMDSKQRCLRCASSSPAPAVPQMRPPSEIQIGAASRRSHSSPNIRIGFGAGRRSTAPTDGGMFRVHDPAEVSWLLGRLESIADQLPEEFDLGPGQKVVSRSRFIEHLRSRIQRPSSRFDPDDVRKLVSVLEHRFAPPP